MVPNLIFVTSQFPRGSSSSLEASGRGRENLTFNLRQKNRFGSLATIAELEVRQSLHRRVNARFLGRWGRYVTASLLGHRQVIRPCGRSSRNIDLQKNILRIFGMTARLCYTQTNAAELFSSRPNRRRVRLSSTLPAHSGYSLGSCCTARWYCESERKYRLLF
jgi:hypothetical protein